MPNHLCSTEQSIGATDCKESVGQETSASEAAGSSSEDVENSAPARQLDFGHLEDSLESASEDAGSGDAASSGPQGIGVLLGSTASGPPVSSIGAGSTGLSGSESSGSVASGSPVEESEVAAGEAAPVGSVHGNEVSELEVKPDDSDMRTSGDADVPGSEDEEATAEEGSFEAEEEMTTLLKSEAGLYLACCMMPNSRDEQNHQERCCWQSQLKLGVLILAMVGLQQCCPITKFPASVLQYTVVSFCCHLGRLPSRGAVLGQGRWRTWYGGAVALFAGAADGRLEE